VQCCGPCFSESNNNNNNDNSNNNLIPLESHCFLCCIANKKLGDKEGNNAISVCLFVCVCKIFVDFLFSLRNKWTLGKNNIVVGYLRCLFFFSFSFLLLCINKQDLGERKILMGILYFSCVFICRNRQEVLLK
jgi:hypothetical protein